MSLEIFGDFGIVGGQDQTADQRQNNQVCINFYPEVDRMNPKEVVALLGCPGLTIVASTGSLTWDSTTITFDSDQITFDADAGFDPTATTWNAPSPVTNLPVRELWPLPGGTESLAVVGNTCYLVTIAAAATAASFPTLTMTAVGTLLTSSGPVSIADNGAGGLAVIVDGTYGYLYTIASNTFGQITDPNFIKAGKVTFIDGWWVFSVPGSQIFYTPQAPYSTVFNASYYALADSGSDNLVTLASNKEELWLLGERHTEIWYDAGGEYFGFQRLVGTPLQIGCAAAASVARFSSEGSDGLVWLGRNDRGECVIVKARGLGYEIISPPSFGEEVQTYPITSDAIGYTYQEDAHEFYVLTFPTADVTWCYDAQTGLMHKRLSYDPYSQTWHRHRSNCFMNFAGMRIVGDYQNGALYQLTRSAYSDAGWPLRALRRAPHIWDKGARSRVFMASLQVDFVPGVGNASGLGSDPKAYLRVSRDGGRTFGQPYSAPIGQQGQYLTRTMWRRLGYGRDVVFEIEVIDPVQRDIVGASLKAISEPQVAQWA